MRVIVAALIVGASLAQACQHPTSPPGKEPIKPGEKTAWNASNNISANSLFGRVQITAMQNMCAGRIQLEQGSATVRDACFTGDTNIVLCTDSTAASAIRCAPGVGNLQLSGTGSDLINYARVR
jgi:hypothetical protein